ncbi:ankyrin repeat domain-containing protein, partial [bacterium]|nr:ankyrin repeat domain-containing protein [bacterium]
VEAYETVGRRNGPWNEDAKAFLEGCVKYICQREDAPTATALDSQAKALMKSRCDDPVVIRLCGSAMAWHDQQDHKEFTVASLESSHLDRYPKIQRYFALHNLQNAASKAGNSDIDRDADGTFQKMIEAFADSVCAGEFPGNDIALAYHLLEWQFPGPFHDVVVKRALKALRQRGGGDPWLANMLEGMAARNLAWKLRGSGFVNVVTPEGWEGFAKYLPVARDAFVRAWEARPDIAYAPREMIPVAMAGYGRLGETERTWFDRAVLAQFDCEQAYSSLLWSMRPRWGGSHAGMIEFGEECLATGRFDTVVPWIYWKALLNVASEQNNNRWRAAYRQPGVRGRLMSLFQGYEELGGFSAEQRSQIAAHRAIAHLWLGEYETARDLLDKIPPDFDLANGFRRYHISYLGLPRKDLETELRLFTGPHKEGLRKAEGLNLDGLEWQSIAAFQEVLDKLPQDDPGRPYLAGRIVATRLSTWLTRQTAFNAAHIAVDGEQDNSASLQFLGKYGFDFNRRDEYGGTALTYALRDQKPKCARWLLENGTDPNARSNLSPLVSAIRTHDTDLFQLLLDKGADVNTPDAAMFTPLAAALEEKQIEMARTLLKSSNIDLNVANHYGATVLEFACEDCAEFPDLALELLRRGADPNTRDHLNWTPLSHAVHRRADSVALAILNKDVELNILNQYGWGPLHLALHYHRLSVAARLIEKGADINQAGPDGRRPLHITAYTGLAEQAAMLLRAGAYIDATNPEGLTPLHVSLLENKRQMAELFINSGANIDQPDGKGVTPLMLAATKGQIEVARILIDKGANIHALCKNNDSALHYAAQNGQAEMVETLLRKGVNRHAADNDGDTPVMLARKANHFAVAALLEN